MHVSMSHYVSRPFNYTKKVISTSNVVTYATRVYVAIYNQ
jgi:hypothetical protein